MQAKHTLRTLICVAALLPLWGQANVEASIQPEDHAETRILRQLLEMEPEKLTQLRKTIERIEQMTPEERQRMRQRITEIRENRQEDISALRAYYRSLSEDRRQAMRKAWFDLPSEERREWRQKLRDVSAEERIAIFEAEGFLPGGERGPRSRNHPRPNEPSSE